MKRFNNCGTANRKRRARPAKRDRSRNMKTSGKAPMRTYMCKTGGGDARERSLVFRTTTHTDRIFTYVGESPRRVAFYIFIPLSPFLPFPSRPPSPHLVERELVNERAHNQLPPAQPPSPSSLPLCHRRLAATLAGDGISHSKRIPRASRSPTRFTDPLLLGQPPRIATPERAPWRISGRNIKHGSCAELHTPPCTCAGYARARQL